MRTREITATGAVQLTNPGTDGTPLRAPESCVWFESPQELRALAEHYLSHPDEAAVIADHAQQLTRGDTYLERGRTLARWLAELV
jgi:spore maturation protein CgeB